MSQDKQLVFSSRSVSPTATYARIVLPPLPAGYDELVVAWVSAWVGVPEPQSIFGLKVFFEVIPASGAAAILSGETYLPASLATTQSGGGIVGYGWGYPFVLRPQSDVAADGPADTLTIFASPVGLTGIPTTANRTISLTAAVWNWYAPWRTG